MNNNYTHVVASFQEVGSTLVSKGKYSTKIVDGKTLVVTEKEPEFKSATKTSAMGLSFIEMALEKPHAPKGSIIGGQRHLKEEWPLNG